MKLGTELHRKAQATDDAWQEALEAAFGKRAGDMRYTRAGQGEPGSELRRLYEARTLAQEAWYADKDWNTYKRAWSGD